jgi:ribosomal protein S14
VTVSRPNSELDRVIAPEIRYDRFYRAIERVAATPGARHILEIGSSSGAGSTKALVSGAQRNPTSPTVHCLEVSRVRFRELAMRYRHIGFVKCYNYSSVPLESFPTADEITEFYRTVGSRLRKVPLELVLSWLRQDIDYPVHNDVPADGIRRVKAAHRIDLFDVVLIDGSEFAGPAELDEVYGARYLMLDDIRTYKNYANYGRLSADPAYRLRKKGAWLRNGFAVFERVD